MEVAEFPKLALKHGILLNLPIQSKLYIYTFLSKGTKELAHWIEE